MAVTLPSGWANFSSGCTECVDTTARGQADISVVTAFDLSPAGDRTSWGFIDDGELYALAGNSFCGGGNMSYVSGDPPMPLDCSGNRNVAIFHYIDDVATRNEALPVPSPPGDGLSFINVIIGISDRPVWAAGSNGYTGTRMYFDLGATRKTYVAMVTTAGQGGFPFAIKGDEVWGGFNQLSGGPPYTAFRVYNRITEAVIATHYPFGNDNSTVGQMHLTDNFLYVIGTLAGVATLYKIARATGTVSSSIILTALSVNFIAVAGDNLIYLLCSGSPGKLYYLENFTTLVYVGYTTGFNFSPFGGGGAIWNNGNLYFGSNGFAGFDIDVRKIVIPCPAIDADPLVASVTTDATVAAGAAINVSWANVLEPAASDTLLIKPEPAAGTYGLVGSTIASATNTTAAQSGTKSITIPGGTTPGNYVAMYAAVGTIWAQTSAVFTVT